MTKIGGSYKDISELDAAAVGAAANQIGVLQGNQEKRMTLTQLAAFASANLTGNLGVLSAASLVLTSGGLSITSGNATLTNGDLVMTSGDILMAVGNLALASGRISAASLTLTSGGLIGNMGAMSANSLDVPNGISVSGTRLAFFGSTKTSQAAALTPAITSSIDGTYGSAENEVLSSCRVRIGELSNMITNYGLTA